MFEDMQDVLEDWYYKLADSDYIKPCPVCGKRPELRYLQEWNVWEISCKPLFRKTHFVFTGKPGQSKREVIKSYKLWRKGVIK